MWNIIPEEQEKSLWGRISSTEIGLPNFTIYWLLKEVFPFSSILFRNNKYVQEPSFDLSLCLACEYSRLTLALFLAARDVALAKYNRHEV